MARLYFVFVLFFNINLFAVAIKNFKISVKSIINGVPTLFRYISNTNEGEEALRADNFFKLPDDHPGFGLTIDGNSGSVFTSNQILKFIMSNSNRIFNGPTRLSLDICLKYDYFGYELEIVDVKVRNNPKGPLNRYNGDDLSKIILCDGSYINLLCQLKPKLKSKPKNESDQKKGCCKN